MDVLGDWWVPMILRESLYGARRFSDFQKMLDISRNILTARLRSMVEHGLLDQRPYGASGNRHEYVLTERGNAALSVLAAMIEWANQWIFDGQPTVELVDKDTGVPIRPKVIDEVSGQPFDARKARIVPGPGFPSHPKALAFRFPDKDSESS